MVILMTMPTPLSLAEVKAHLSELVSRVNRQHERITVTVHGKPSAVLISADDLESMEETISLLSSEQAMRDLLTSEAELAQGEMVTQDELAAAMAARRRQAS
jgi:antitoxin YefM